MKRSRERRASRRPSNTPPPTMGNGSDEDGFDATQQQEHENVSVTSASAVSKRKRTRTRSRTPPPQSSSADKLSTRSTRSRRDENKEKSPVGKGNREKIEKKEDTHETSSDGSEQDDEIPISQLATLAATDDCLVEKDSEAFDADETDQAQEQTRRGPQAPSGVDSVKVAHKEMKESSSQKGQAQGASASTSSKRPNKVKERDKDDPDESTGKRSVIEIESGKGGIVTQSRAGGDSVIIEKAKPLQSDAPSKQNYPQSQIPGEERMSQGSGSSKNAKKSPELEKSKRCNSGEWPAHQVLGHRHLGQPDEKSTPDGGISDSRHDHGKWREMAIEGHQDSIRYVDEPESDAKGKRRILNGSACVDEDSVTANVKKESERKCKRQRSEHEPASVATKGIIGESSGRINHAASIASLLQGQKPDREAQLQTALPAADDKACEQRVAGLTNVIAENRPIGPAETTGNESKAGQPARTSTAGVFPSVESIKIELYLEGIRVHRGRGSERRFADYWDALNRYISSGSHDKRFSSERSSFGIEAELTSFLKTKKLKRLHNRVILAIMKQSMEERVPSAVYRQHLPSRWNMAVQIGSSASLLPSPSSAAVSITREVAKPEIIESLQQQRDDSDIRRLRHNFARDSDIWTSFGSEKRAGNFSTSAGVKEVSRNPPEKRNSEVGLSASNLPGALSIDPAVRGLAGRHGMSVSESAIWLLVVAVRAHASAILRHTISAIETSDKDQTSPLAVELGDGSLSKTRDDENGENSAQGSIAMASESGEDKCIFGGVTKKKKHSTIGVFDVAQTLTSNPMLSNGHGNVFKTRVAWDRCISAVNGTLSAGSPSQMDVSCSDVIECIQVASEKREQTQAVLKSEMKGVTEISRAQKDGSIKASIAARTDGGSACVGDSSASVADSVQKKVQGGKDLSAMKKTTGSAPGGEADNNIIENGDASPSRPTSTSPTPARRGRGTGAKNLAAMRAGAKNLAAMRARRTTSTGGKQDEDQGQETKEGENIVAVNS